MGLYNIEKPCVVGQLHYVHVPDQPIEVDNDVAAPLVEAGDLSPYRAADLATAVAESDGEDIGPGLVRVFDAKPAEESKPRTRRRAAED